MTRWSKAAVVAAFVAGLLCAAVAEAQRAELHAQQFAQRILQAAAQRDRRAHADFDAGQRLPAVGAGREDRRDLKLPIMDQSFQDRTARSIQGHHSSGFHYC